MKHARLFFNDPNGSGNFSDFSGDSCGFSCEVDESSAHGLNDLISDSDLLTIIHEWDHLPQVTKNKIVLLVERWKAKSIKPT